MGRHAALEPPIPREIEIMNRSRPPIVDAYDQVSALSSFAQLVSSSTIHRCEKTCDSRHKIVDSLRDSLFFILRKTVTSYILGGRITSLET